MVLRNHDTVAQFAARSHGLWEASEVKMEAREFSWGMTIARVDPSLSVTAQQASRTIVGHFKDEVTINTRIGLGVQLSHYADLERATRGNHSNSKATS